MPPRRESNCEPDQDDEILDGFKPPRLITDFEKESRCRPVIIRVVPELIGTVDEPNSGRWKIPNWGREPRVNKFVNTVAEDLKGRSHLKSNLILGIYDNTIWRIDGNHRLLGFLLSGIPCMTAHCMVHHCNGHEDMYRIYRIYQRHLRPPTKDDNLKGFEVTHPPLKTISSRCKFVTYGTVNDTENRRIKMSAVIQIWFDSMPYVPRHTRGNIEEQAGRIDEPSARKINEFLMVCKEGLSLQLGVLWKPLNIVLLMWLYRRLVWGEVDVENEGEEYPTLTRDEFVRGLLGLQTNGYYGTLFAKKLEEDRFATYTSLLSYFKKSLSNNGVKRRIKLPTKPNWPADPTPDSHRR